MTTTARPVGDLPADPFAAHDTTDYGMPTDTEKGITTVRITNPLLLAARRAALTVQADDNGDADSTDPLDL